LNPICFTPQGQLIGDAVAFKELLNEKYRVEDLSISPLDETDATVKNRNFALCFLNGF
jgi:uncharacterized protein (UPF0210 family)